MSETPPSLAKLYDVPISPSFFSWRTFLKYVGPGWIMSLAFIDPGNIEADLQSGAFTGFTFAWVLLLAHVAGLAVQVFASRLGAVTGQGLARVCRDHYPHHLNLFLWLMAELAIICSDVQEVVGSSIALNLLFGFPLWLGVLVTGFTTIVFLVLYMYRGLEFIEIIIIATIGVILSCFSLDFVATGPNLTNLFKGIFVPSVPSSPAATLQLVALIGSVVMPHNLFLYSSLIAKKQLNRSSKLQLTQAVKYFLFDAAIALFVSFLINLSLQGSFAQGFFSPICAENPTGSLGCDPRLVSQAEATGCDMLDCACVTPSGLSGFCSQVGLTNAGNALNFILPEKAAFLFGLGLLAAGQASTVSGTMAGQYVMEGFLELKISFWLRMLLTRGVALLPAIAVSLMQSEFEAMNTLSQSLNVVQAIQLPFALFPLLHFSGQKHLLGSFTLGSKMASAGWLLALSLFAVNIFLIFQKSDKWQPFEIFISVIYVFLITWVARADLKLFFLWIAGKRNKKPEEAPFSAHLLAYPDSPMTINESS